MRRDWASADDHETLATVFSDQSSGRESVPLLEFDIDPTALDRLKSLPALRAMASGRAIAQDFRTSFACASDRAEQVELELVGNRSTRHLAPTPAHRIRLDIVAGNLRADNVRGDGLRNAIASRPVCRLAVAVETGTPEGAMAVIDAIRAQVPLRTAPFDYPTLGTRLLDGTSAVRAQAVTLAPDMPTGRALAQIVDSCITQWIANEAAVLDPARVEGVHQMRVALRRLRAALTLARHVAPLVPSSTLGEGVRDLAATLGQVRDWDVFLIETLAPVEEAFPHDPGLALLRRAAIDARHAAFQRADALVRSERYIDLVLAARAWCWNATRLETIHTIGTVGDAFLDRRYDALCRHGHRLKQLSLEQKHALRIRAKKLRYAGDFFQALHTGRKTRKFLSALADVQDALGVLNDRAMAARLVGELQAKTRGTKLDRAAGLVLGWHAAAVTLHADDVYDLWDAFADAKPFWR